MRLSEPKRKPQVLFFSSELVFSEASSPSMKDTVMFCEASSLRTRDIVLCSSWIFKYVRYP